MKLTSSKPFGGGNLFDNRRLGNPDNDASILPLKPLNAKHVRCEMRAWLVSITGVSVAVR